MTLESVFSNNDKKSNVPSLEEMDSLIAERLQEATNQIEEITPALHELAQKIKSERPDVLVFLDMSARIFGTPYLKYLREEMEEKTPVIRFFNDDKLKGSFLDGENFIEVVTSEFKDLVGKKVFFVDETFSGGKGATTLLRAAEMTNVEASYIAFSKDPNPSNTSYITEQDEQLIKDGIHTGHVCIFDYPITNLFSRWASRLYVQDFQGETLPVERQLKNDDNSGGIPDANSYIKPPEGMSIAEYTQASSDKIETATKTIKNLIYDVLVKSK